MDPGGVTGILTVRTIRSHNLSLILGSNEGGKNSAHVVMSKT